MDTSLAGQRALVVGGSSGIGRAIARALIDEGADVAIGGRRDASEEGRGLDFGQGRTVYVRGDISTKTGAESLVMTAEHALGGLTLMVNTAAFRHNDGIAALTSNDLELSFSTNVLGCIYLCQSVARQFIAQGRGSIVVLGSTATASAQPGETAYRASKAALKAHVEVLAVELAPHGIRANLVTPGATDTPFLEGLGQAQRARAIDAVPLGREAQPEEIAPAVLFLLSDRLASYITGSELFVDGGLHLRPIIGGSWTDVRAMNRAGDRAEGAIEE